MNSYLYCLVVNTIIVSAVLFIIYQVSRGTDTNILWIAFILIMCFTTPRKDKEITCPKCGSNLIIQRDKDEIKVSVVEKDKEKNLQNRIEEN